MRWRGLILCGCFVTICCMGAETITTVAGTGFTGQSGNGGPALLAEVELYERLILDETRNVLFLPKITETRKIDLVTGIIDIGDASLAAVDKLGNYYFATFHEGALPGFKITKRKIDGTSVPVAGIGPVAVKSFQDGISAQEAYISDIFNPRRFLVDENGDLYYCDEPGIRKIDAVSGLVTTIVNRQVLLASTNSVETDLFIIDRFAIHNGEAYVACSYNVIGGRNNPILKVNLATGTVSTLRSREAIRDLITDSIGNLLFTTEHGINKIDKQGVETVLSGSGYHLGDGGQATETLLYGVYGLAVSSDGSLYFSEFPNFFSSFKSFPVYKIKRLHSSSVLHPDTDGDGFTDMIEQGTGTSALDPSSSPFLADADEDGFSDETESRLSAILGQHVNPDNPDSPLIGANRKKRLPAIAFPTVKIRKNKFSFKNATVDYVGIEVFSDATAIPNLSGLRVIVNIGGTATQFTLENKSKSNLKAKAKTRTGSIKAKYDSKLAFILNQGNMTFGSIFRVSGSFKSPAPIPPADIIALQKQPLLGYVALDNQIFPFCLIFKKGKYIPENQ